MRILLLFTAYLLVIASYGQSKKTYRDSLKNELVVNPLQDTNRAIVLYRLCFEYRFIDIDSAENYGNSALRLSMELNFQKGIGASYNNLGLVYETRGEDVKALKYFILALDAKRKTGDLKSTASTLNNIGILYKKQEYYAKALEYYREAIVLNKQSNNLAFLEINYFNSANCHKGLHHGDSALYYYDLAYDLAIRLNNYREVSNILAGKGNYYIDIGEYAQGLHYVDSALAVAATYDATHDLHILYEAKGRAFLKMNQLDSAKVYLFKAWELKKDSREWGAMSNISLLLSDYYDARYNAAPHDSLLEKAYSYLALSYTLRDSAINSRKLNSIFELVTEDLVNQKDAEIESIQREKELVDLRASNERQAKLIIAVIALAVVVVLIGLWLRFRKNKILNRKLADQNIQIERKNKEIIDSITYAKRLQEAILPPPGYLKQFYPGSFILYLPKDIVAGDFYWAEISGDRLYVAAADCTGHGVPGAMVSVVCANALERAVKEFNIRETSAILDKTRELVVQTFQKSAEMVNDGMDISLLSLPLTPGVSNAQWSGANNPILIVRNGALIEIKGDKQPIGRFEHASSFTAHEVELRKGDWLYLITDGYADQFGGPHEKKFKYAALKEKFISISSLPADEQVAQLIQAHQDWKGSLDQVDDICIIGLQVM